ncbi:HAMP domain-containing sensor histidine kinase [Pelobacter propionicus]|uniref:histidine kinase n=1 Tax=Pelobacter propionicus (strain DSM 2379 / NBRC 103807 / OttBd1) TaxID=338966 RepID=A0R7L5_PELPD|nr:ATP-binding protein [Pelobacter propionicus]ABL01225.1 integral membrane sensor signal transduction histidine kinase [Pelobacter propionicus DSM 2379]
MTSTVFNNMPLAGKLQRLLVKSIFICCCVIAISQCLSLAYTFNKEFDTSARKTADIIARNIEPTLNFGDIDTATKFLQSLSVDDTIEAAAVYDNNGELFALYSNKAGQVPSYNKNIDIGTSIIRQEIHKRIISTNTLRQGEKLGTIYIKYKPSVLYLSLLTSISFLAIAFVIAYVAGKYLIRTHIPTITKPIEKLTETATIIANKKQYDIRIPVSYCDEIGRMTDSFNEMLEQINQRDMELVAIQEDLENQVVLRTRQLAEQTEELKKLNTDLQHFVAIMRHDLRAPMLNLTIYLSDIKEKTHKLAKFIYSNRNTMSQNDNDIIEKITVDIEYGIEINVKAIQTINNIFNAVMEITAISKLKVDCKPFNPYFTIKCLVDTYKEKADANNVNVKLLDMPLIIVTDRKILSKILACLLDNAIKFTANSLVREVSIRCEESLYDWKIHVADTGPGVPDYMNNRIFDLFRRGDQETPDDSSGFGLAYAKTLASRLRATIEWNSVEGEGSVFTVVIRKAANA